MPNPAPTDGSICFPHLSHMNYVNWAMHMEAVLVCQGYWDLFEEKVLLEEKEGLEVKRIKKRMAETRATLILGENLAKVHHTHGFSSHLALHCAFITASIKEGQTMEAWIREVCSIANHLTAIDIFTSDENIIIVLTASLPPSYETIIISLDAIKPEELTLNFVITCLLNEESHQNLTDTTTTATMLESEGEKPGLDAMAVTNKTGSTMTCFYCGSIGHFTASCKTRLKHFKSIDEKFAGFAVFSEDEKENYAF
ncbi:hypothetical protein E4T56_gene2752 [Termitomyces sp. T112]|nr:hypothetical protein E4T56_gene2752 [Termitomyces sp. T112]